MDIGSQGLMGTWESDGKKPAVILPPLSVRLIVAPAGKGGVS